jgi:hypothetical protein
VELFEVIRRGYAAGETTQGLSKKHGVHRRIGRQAIGNAIPPVRKAVVREAPRLSPVMAHIERMGPLTFRLLANSGIRLIGSGCGSVRSIRSTRSGKPRCGAMCGSGSGSWDSAGGKCPCRRATSWARKRTWIGSKPWPSWAAKRASCRILETDLPEALKPYGTGWSNISQYFTTTAKTLHAEESLEVGFHPWSASYASSGQG